MTDDEKRKAAREATARYRKRHPDRVAKQNERTNELKRTPEYRAKANERRRERYRNDPEYKARAVERRRQTAPKGRYGLTAEEIKQMRAAQGGACAICGTKAVRLCVDHCHNSGRVRKLLCQQCNSMLGMARDNPEILRAGIRYLEECE